MRKRRCGGGIACLITVCHEAARTTIESRFSPIAAATHAQLTSGEDVPTTPPLGPTPPHEHDRDGEQPDRHEQRPAALVSSQAAAFT